MTSSESFDVIIIGGGPAGAAAAITLARNGFRTAIIERSNYSTLRIGETLPAAIRSLLISLDVWEHFLADGHVESFAIRSVWGDAEQRENDSIFNPYGSGWHIDRGRFDRMLATAAETGGSSVLTEARITHLSKDKILGWQVEVLQNNHHRCLSALCIIDATGQTAVIPVGLPRTFHVVDHLIGVVCFLARMAEPYILVEAIDCGWWYSVPLPHDRLVAAYMTDADLLAAAHSSPYDHWQLQLRKAELTCARIDSQTTLTKPKIVSAASVIRHPVIGKNWLATGDASITFDPLSGRGVYSALQGGILAGEAIIASFCGNSESFTKYSDWINGQFSNYLQMRTSFYSKEQRWSQSPFWRRRHTLTKR
jgi:flavin-dependent dehydrogenase